MKDPKIQELTKIREAAVKKLQSIESVIEGLQALCEHKDCVSLGYRHNDEQYECRDCGHKWWA